MVKMIIIGLVMLILVFIVIYSFNTQILENYEYTTIYNCNECKNKTFGQCTQCGSCLWVRGYDYKNNKFFAECVKGDEHGPWNNKRKDKVIMWKYSRDPFYNNPYISMI